MELKHLETNFISCQNIVLFIEPEECNPRRTFIVGYMPTGHYEVIKIDFQRDPNSSLAQIITPCQHFPTFQATRTYISSKVANYLTVKKCYIGGIIGFARFLQGYYLLYASETEVVGRINEHVINRIINIEILQLFTNIQDSTYKDQQKYLLLLKEYKPQDIYFSMSYDLTESMQNNLMGHIRMQKQLRWNDYLSEEASKIMGDKWLLTCICGYYRQIDKISWNKNTFDVALIGRRSNKHCGTRYLKRGIDSQGNAANFVQTQQIVLKKLKDTCWVSAYVQARGSVPIYWLQQPQLLKAQPPIKIIHNQQLNDATRKHFSDLIRRYGNLIFCLNLMKTQGSSSRQMDLSDQYRKALNCMNHSNIKYMQFDMKNNLKQNPSFKLHSQVIAYHMVSSTGLFIAMQSDMKQHLEFQNGIVRTNCVDCIDRTNSFQEIIGKVALGIQMRILSDHVFVYPAFMASQLINTLFVQLFEQLGDDIAVQYGGSEAHKKKQGDHDSSLLVNIKRHLNNNLNDPKKQQILDAFLGNFSTEKPYFYDTAPTIAHKPHPKIKEVLGQLWQVNSYDQFKMKFKMFQPFKTTSGYLTQENHEAFLKQIAEMKDPKIMSYMKSTNNHQFIHFSLKLMTKDKKKLSIAEDIIKINESKKEPSIFKDV